MIDIDFYDSKFSSYIINGKTNEIIKYYKENNISLLQKNKDNLNILEICAFSESKSFQDLFNKLNKNEQQNFIENNNYEFIKNLFLEDSIESLKFILPKLPISVFAKYFNKDTYNHELSTTQLDNLLLNYLTENGINEKTCLVEDNYDLGFICAEYNLSKTFSYLIENNYVFSKYNNHDFLKEIAINYKSLDIIKDLKNAGINFNKQEIDIIIDYLIKDFNIDLFNTMHQDFYFSSVVNKSGNKNLLLKSIENKNYVAIEYLLSCNANIKVIDEKQNNVLILSTELEDINLVERFLNKGIDLTQKDELGCTAAFYAVFKGNNEILEKLLEKQYFMYSGIIEKNSNGENAIDIAIKEDNFKALQLILKTALPLKYLDKKQQQTIKLEEIDGFDLPYLEIEEEQMTTLAELIHKGFDFNFYVEDSSLVLHYFKNQGSINDIRQLVKLGSDPLHKNNNGESAITYAIEKKPDYAIEMIKTNLIDVSLIENDLFNKIKEDKDFSIKLFNISTFINKPTAKNLLIKLIENNISLEDNLNFSDLVFSDKIEINDLADIFEKILNKKNMDSEKLIIYTYIKEKFEEEYLKDILNLCNNNDKSLKQVIEKDLNLITKKLKIK